MNEHTFHRVYYTTFCSFFYLHNKYHLLNMLKIKCDINQQYLKKKLTSILSNMNNFHSLEVVDRVSETQFQMGENSDWKILQLKV